MSIINYIFFAKVQGQNISSREKIADWCLSPTRYFFGGRTVDLIQRGDKFAIQLRKPFRASHYEVALKVAALIPGLIVGGLMKWVVIWSKRKAPEVTYISQHVKDPIDQVHGPDELFVKGIRDVIAALHQLKANSRVYPQRGKYQNLLSEQKILEIDPVKLHAELILEQLRGKEKTHSMGGVVVKKPAARKPEKKQPLTPAQVVMRNIDLFWNLKFLFMSSERHVELSQKEMLLRLNPGIVYDHVSNNPKYPFREASYTFAREIPAFQGRGHRLVG